MGQSFTQSQYAELLHAALEGGYRFRGFEEDTGEPGTLLLRHDIDKDVLVARRIAELEREVGVRSTYFFLLRCPLYNVLEVETRNHIRAIAELGHWIGLHCDQRRTALVHHTPAELDASVLYEIDVLEAVLGIRCTRAVSFHNPSRELIGRVPTADEYISTYDPRFMLPHTKYISESNARWREGNPVELLRAAQWQRVQVLVHPIWWGGETPQDTLAVLQDVLSRRAEELDAYLRWSNHLWQEHRTSAPLAPSEIRPGSGL